MRPRDGDDDGGGGCDGKAGVKVAVVVRGPNDPPVASASSSPDPFAFDRRTTRKKFAENKKLFGWLNLLFQLRIIKLR